MADENEPVDPGEGAPLEDRVAYARARMEKRRLARIDQWQKKTLAEPGTDDSPPAQQTTADAPAAVASVAGAAARPSFDPTRDRRLMAPPGGDAPAPAGGGSGSNSEIMEEMRKQTDLLRQIANNQGAKWG